MNDRSLFDKLAANRLTANLVYDQLISQGKKQEEIAQAIKPIVEFKDNLLKEALKSDIKGLIQAAQMFESEIERHNMDIARLLEKRSSVEIHLTEIKSILIAQMKEQNTQVLFDRDYSATLTEHQGKDVITFR